MIFPITLFIFTLLFIIIRPKNLQIGSIALIGATFATVFQIVSFNDIFEVIKIVWNPTLAFIGIIIVSMILDKIGFFEWSALYLIRFSKGSGNLIFIYSLILGSLTSAFFANDGAALILTPILLAQMRALKLKNATILAFLLAGNFIIDFASLPFVFSNLTNILTANYFDISFGTYFLNMFFPFIVVTIFSTIFLWLIFKRNIPKSINLTELKNPNEAIKNLRLFKISWFFIILLLFSYFLGDIFHLPISILTIFGSLILLFICKNEVKPKEILKSAPWDIVYFSIGLYIVVYGLKNAGLTEYLSAYFQTLDKSLFSTLKVGFIAAFISAFTNNLPAIMIMDISLHSISNETLIYANIIGCNIGPKLTPFGSLATLLWLHMLNQNGVKISFKKYFKFSFLITLPVLFVTLLAI